MTLESQVIRPTGSACCHFISTYIKETEKLRKVSTQSKGKVPCVNNMEGFLLDFKQTELWTCTCIMHSYIFKACGKKHSLEPPLCMHAKKKYSQFDLSGQGNAVQSSLSLWGWDGRTLCSAAAGPCHWPEMYMNTQNMRLNTQIVGNQWIYTCIHMCWIYNHAVRLHNHKMILC